MGVAERRERERGMLRSRIVDAARDLLLEEGLAGLSMRAIADRIEYSPATIYIYFKDKDELIREVVHTGFELLGAMVAEELEPLGESRRAPDEYGAVARGYVRFALANPAYFRVMFELPTTAELRCDEHEAGCAGGSDGAAGGAGAVLRRVVSGTHYDSPEARQLGLMGWALIHGLTTLYLAGQLRAEAATVEEFRGLIDGAIRLFQDGWTRMRAGVEA